MSRSSQNRSHTRALLLALVAVPVLFVVCAALQVRIDSDTRVMNQDKDELLLRSGWLLKKLSLGYEPLLADIYWTRVVQYYGRRARKPGATYESLWPLLDITTTLDPKLMIAYRFGAVFLSEEPPVGPGRTDQAVDLVKRGIAENPDEWRLYQDLGFLYSIHLKDYQKAAEAYLEGSKNPHSQIWMKVMAARVAEAGNALETSKLIWIEVYSNSKDELIRRRATQHIHALDAALGLKKLNESSEDYWRKFGRFPASMQELRDAGLVGGALQDPEGFPYVMGPNGVPQLNPKSTIVLDSDQGAEKLR
jgi:tetratricopeptide (TPR) repeat protein